jgi:hypothetical protein
MKTFLAVLMLVGTTLAEQCEVLEMGTNAALSSSPAITQDYGRTKVTTGGVSTSSYRVYTVRLDKSIYQIVPQRGWFPRLVVGHSVECRMKKDDIIIRDGYHYSIVAERPVQ